MKRGIDNKVISINFKSYLSLIIGFILICSFFSLIIASDNPELDKEVEEALKNIQLKGVNYAYADFKALDSAVRQKVLQEHLTELMPMLKKSNVADRQELLKNHEGDFVIGFNSNSFDISKKAELFQEKDEKKTLILEDGLRNKLWQSLGDDKKRGDLLLKINPVLKEVSLKASDKLNWKGLNLIGEKGGFQNFDSNSDSSQISSSPHPSMTGFSYVDGKIKEKFKTGREISFGEGNLQWKKEVDNKETGDTVNSIFYTGKDGKIVGETRGLNLAYGGISEENGETSLIDIGYNAKGNVDFKFSGVAKETYISLNDQFNNKYKIGMGDLVDDDGKFIGGVLEVRKVGKEEFLAIQGNSKAVTVGLGEIKTKGNDFTVFGGTYFDNPGKGAMNLDQRIELEKNKVDYTQVVGKTLGGLFGGSISGFSQAKKDETDEAIKRLISRTPVALGAGENYANVNYFIDEVSNDAMVAKKQGVSLPYIEYSMGGKGVEIDVSDAYTKVNRVYANSGFSEEDNQLLLKDGPSYVAFRGDQTFVNRVSLDATSNFAGLDSVIGIDSIVNEKSKDSWKIQGDGSGGYDLFNTGVMGPRVVKEVQTVDVRKSSRNVGIVDAAEISVTNPPKDTGAYAGDYKDTIVEISAIGTREPGTGIGREGGFIERFVNNKGAENTISTMNIAGEIANNLIGTIGEAVQSSGGVSGFEVQMKNFGDLSGKSTAELQKIIPGYTNLLPDFKYVWENPQKVDETLKAIANAGEISKGTSLQLTMNNGAFLGQTQISGTDPTVVRLLASSIFSREESSKNLGFRKTAEQAAIIQRQIYSSQFDSGELSFSNVQKTLREAAKKPVTATN